MPRLRLKRHAAYNDQEEAIRLAVVKAYRKGADEGFRDGSANMQYRFDESQRKLARAVREREAAHKSYAIACQQLEKLEEELANSREMAQALMHQHGPDFTISVHSPIGKATLHGLNLDHEIRLFRKKTEAAQKILSMDMAAVEMRVAGRRIGHQQTSARQTEAPWRFEENLYDTFSNQTLHDFWARHPSRPEFTSILSDPATPETHRGQAIAETLYNRHRAGEFSFGGTVTGRVSSRGMNPSNTPQAIIDTEVAEAGPGHARWGDIRFIGFHRRNVTEQLGQVRLDNDIVPNSDAESETRLRYAMNHPTPTPPVGPFEGQYWVDMRDVLHVMEGGTWVEAGEIRSVATTQGSQPERLAYFNDSHVQSRGEWHPNPESTREELTQHALNHRGSTRPRDPFVGQFYCSQSGQLECMTTLGWSNAGQVINGLLYPHYGFEWPGTAHLRPDGHPRGVEEEEEHGAETVTLTGTSIMGVDLEIGDRIETSDGRSYIYRGEGVFDPVEPPRGIMRLDSLSGLRRSGVMSNERRTAPQEETTSFSGIDRAEAGQDWTSVVNFDRDRIARVFRGGGVVYASAVRLGSFDESEEGDSEGIGDEDDDEEEDDEEETEERNLFQEGLAESILRRADEAARNLGDPDFDDEDEEEEDPADDENYRPGP